MRNMRVDKSEQNSSKFESSEKGFEKINNVSAVSRTLSSLESGKLFAVSMAAEDNNVTITLPSVSDAIAGCNYDFCFTVASDDDADFILTTGASATDIYGYIVRGAADSTVDDFDGLSKITVDGSASQAVEGLRISVICDGTNWHLSGYAPVALGTALLVESASA
tara:strand:- start:301 stop:795 length:495 start_codon:yes stop_codon:yes gene_type:complete